MKVETILGKHIHQSEELKRLKEVYTEKCLAILGPVGQESKDMIALEELVLEVMANESPEAIEALKQVLTERRAQREERLKNLGDTPNKLIMDPGDNLVDEKNYRSGEKG